MLAEALQTTQIICPVCGGQLISEDERISCQGCSRSFPMDGMEIPLLFWPNESTGNVEDVTDKVRAFYEETPFPNYDSLDTRESLQAKARRGIYARLLDEQLPPGAVVLEAGCGTGQLTNFLGQHWNRRCVGSDICLNSLRLAKGFRDRQAIRNASFVQMNLFRPVFAPESFDAVITNGVLHATNDPYGGFKSLARLIRPGGIVVIGLYNHIGRLPTLFRRSLFRMTGSTFLWLDGNIRNKKYNPGRFQAWFRDQYEHPHETTHCYSEVLEWFDREKFEFLFALPKIDGSPLTGEDRLFEPHSPGTRFTRWLTEVEMLLQGGADGALYVMIGRKSQ
ncbi:MAG: class I SAM-dependent methyltransferase [Bryobacteraceae bacterium]